MQHVTHVSVMLLMLCNMFFQILRLACTENIENLNRAARSKDSNCQTIMFGYFHLYFTFKRIEFHCVFLGNLETVSQQQCILAIRAGCFKCFCLRTVWHRPTGHGPSILTPDAIQSQNGSRNHGFPMKKLFVGGMARMGR